jgi:hypothetical protein
MQAECKGWRLAYSSTVTMKTVRSSETSENFCQTTWHHIPKGVFITKIPYRIYANISTLLLPVPPPPPRSNSLPSTLFRNILYLRVYAYCITCENYGFIYRRTWCISEALWWPDVILHLDKSMSVVSKPYLMPLPDFTRPSSCICVYVDKDTLFCFSVLKSAHFSLPSLNIYHDILRIIIKSVLLDNFPKIKTSVLTRYNTA